MQNATDRSYREILVSPGSERAILTICLKNNDKLLEVDTIGVEAKHFGIDANRFIFIAMQYLYTKQQTPTAISIKEVITSEKGKRALEEMGGMEYIASLEVANVSGDNIKIFSDKLLQAYTRRNICDMCFDIQQEMLNEKSDTLNPDELVGRVEHGVNELCVTNTSAKDAYKMGDDTERILEERAKTPARIPGLETGWRQLDVLTGGFQPGDFVVLVARSKCGKSVTLTNWATNLSVNQGLPVLYIDTEMTAREQEDRILARLSNIPHSEIQSGLYALDTDYGTAEEKRIQLQLAKEQLKDGQYYHAYMPDMNIDKIKTLVRKYKAQHNICAVFFDYMKLTSNQASVLKSSQEYQALGFLASGLKELGGTLGIPIITSAQENRIDVKGTTKDASNVGGSDRILQNATKLMFLYNKSEEDIALNGELAGNQELYIAYQRNGACDCTPINIYFNRPYISQMEV